eukprot:GEMP01050873.1.p1 GENE.GEMP01050873.1~~GEMP01050873.1.p1  ORF type:complete len:325 (+),score=58.04 GEMP01050873.1:320-1294(+)
MFISALTLAASRVIAARTRGWWHIMFWRVVSHCAGYFFLITTSASLMDLAKGDKKLIQLLKTSESLVKGIGMATGPLIAGLVSKRYGARSPFYVSAAIAVGAAVHVLACVPETLEVEDRRRFKPRMKSLLGFTKMFTNVRLARLAVMSMLVDVPLRTGPIFPLMTKYRFGWKSDTTGKWVFLYSICAPVSSVVHTKMLSRFGENGSMNFQILMSFTAIACLTASKRGRLFWASIPFFAVGLAKPTAVRGHVTKQFTQDMSIGHGELSGILGSTAMLSNALATQMHSQAFAYFISDAAPFQFPAAPFFLCCVSDVLVFALYNLKP